MEKWVQDSNGTAEKANGRGKTEKQQPLVQDNSLVDFFEKFASKLKQLQSPLEVECNTKGLKKSKSWLDHI